MAFRTTTREWAVVCDCVGIWREGEMMRRLMRVRRKEGREQKVLTRVTIRPGQSNQNQVQIKSSQSV